MDNFEKQMMKKAVEILDEQPELKKQSEIREKYKFQIETEFDQEDGLGRDDLERRPCTEIERKKLDASMEQLGDFFADADFFWQLDGALNISLYAGEYIGIHKDIDISIDETELDKVESFLAKKGYGLFLLSWNEQEKQRRFERVSADRFKKNVSSQGMIISIDNDGEIIHDSAASHLDTHLIRRDKNGLRIGREFTPLPQEWYKPRIINFHEREIHCSHPALVGFYKLFHSRAYDDNDLKLLAKSGKLTQSDVDLIEKTFNQHVDDLQGTIRDFVNRVFSHFKQGQNSQEIFDILINDDLIKNMRSGNSETEKFMGDLAEKLAEDEGKTPDKLFEILLDTSPTKKLLSMKDKKFAILRENMPG
jgi:hypothetical protein